MSSTQPTRASNLLLFPTELEHRRFADYGGLEPELALQLVCGFGPIAAAIRTTQLIARIRPRHVLLVGIAGAYDGERDPVGEARVFSTVSIEGIGAGRGVELIGPNKLGFPQWPGSDDTRTTPIDESIELACPPDVGCGELLTTCAASDSPAHAAERLERHPRAVAEDMEGYAVAMACAFEEIPLTIVRGISNVVGDRRPENWRIPSALAAARRLLIELFESGAFAAVDGPSDGDAT